MENQARSQLRKSRVKSVLLVSTKIPPRETLFNQILETVVINEDYLAKTPPWWRRQIYRIFPTFLAQITETYVIKKKFDVVVSWSDPNALLFALLLKLTRSRFPHVAMMYWPSGRNKEALLKFVHPYITTLCLWTSTHKNLVINKVGVPAEKIRMIPQSVDTEFFHPTQVETDMICAVGQEMRDYPTLIEAMRGSTIKCHLATGSTPGSVKVYDTVKVVYRKETSLPANVTAAPLGVEALRDLYARSRFVVVPLLPTDSDHGSSTITEAMAMGKAVICSLTKGQREVIVDGKTGIYVPQGDPKALREAIEYLWSHPEVADRMGREGRKVIEQKFTVENFVARVRDIVEETAVGSSGEYVAAV